MLVSIHFNSVQQYRPRDFGVMADTFGDQRERRLVTTFHELEPDWPGGCGRSSGYGAPREGVVLPPSM